MNNQLDCSLVNDILPLYIDDTLSDTTKKMVREHLDNCEKCASLMKTMTEDIMVTSEPKDVTTIKKIKNKITHKMIIFATIVILLLSGIGVGAFFISKWIQVNKHVSVDMNNVAFYYRASPYVIDDLNVYIRNNQTVMLKDELPSDDPEDYLIMSYKLAINNKSHANVKFHKTIFSKSGKYTNNIIARRDEQYGDVTHGTTFSGGFMPGSDFYIYVGNLNETEKEEMMKDLCFKVSIFNSIFESPEISITPKETKLVYYIKTIADYERLENKYKNFAGWNELESTVLSGLGYFASSDIVTSIYCKNFAIADLDKDKFTMTSGDAKFNYLFEIGDIEDYCVLVESDYELMNKEHVNDIVTENTYLVEKSTGKKILKFSDGEYEKFEKLLNE